MEKLTTEIEIEKKYLSSLQFLIDLQNKYNLESQVIYQIYTLDENGDYIRYRKINSKYFYNPKFKLESSAQFNVCKEFLQEITKEEFDLLESTAICAIQKIRYIFNIEGIKYEFDVFTSLDIVTCEIETKTQDNIEIPEFMQKYLIADITHIKSLSNLSLALKYGKINN